MLALLALALLPLALARPKVAPAFDVTNLYTFEPSGRDNVSVYRVKFNVTDPSDGAATACETTWPYAQWNTGYPHDFVRMVISVHIVQRWGNRTLLSLG